MKEGEVIQHHDFKIYVTAEKSRRKRFESVNVSAGI
jgi:hypothetical protein